MEVINFLDRKYLYPKTFILNERSVKGLLGTPIEALRSGVDMDLYKAAINPINAKSKEKLRTLIG